MSLVAIVAPDLIIATRIADAATAAGHQVLRVDRPSDLPPASEVAVAFVDWGAREPDWGDELSSWRESAQHPAIPRLIVFGPHTDLAAHAQARAAGLGPMIARSKLVRGLGDLIQPDRT